MKFYFDMCAFKRPFDDFTQSRVQDEALAVLNLLQRIEAGDDSLVWSAALSLENDADPDEEVREAVGQWERYARERACLSDQVVLRIRELRRAKWPALDAAHLAYAESIPCDVLLTCDEKFLRRARRKPALIRVTNPLEFWREVSGEQ